MKKENTKTKLHSTPITQRRFSNSGAETMMDRSAASSGEKCENKSDYVMSTS